MDKNVLIQYADMQQEVRDIRRRIDEIERKLNRMIESKEMVSDTVKGTRSDGIFGSIKITGFPDQEYSKKKQSLKRLKTKLEQTEEELLEMMTNALNQQPLSDGSDAEALTAEETKDVTNE